MIHYKLIYISSIIGDVYLLAAYIPASRDNSVWFGFRPGKIGALVRPVSCKVVQNEHEIAKIRNELPGVS